MSSSHSGKQGRIQVVLGTMTFGWKQSSTFLDGKSSKELLDEFLSCHPTHIEVDTAYMYGGGETEKILGSILPAGDGKVPYQIATKAGPWSNMVLGKGGAMNSSGGAGGLSPELLRLQVETSLQRMNRSSVHLLYLHAPDVETPLEDTLKEVKKLHEEGKFTELGLSNFSAWETVQVYYLCEKLNMVKPTVYQGMYNAICRQVEMELFPCLERLGIRFLAYNPLAAGLLTGKHDFSKPVPDGRFKGNAMYMDRYWKQEYFAMLGEVQKVCEEAGEKDFTAVSLRWLKHHSQLKTSRGDGIIIGASNIDHLKQNCAAIDEGDVLPEKVVKSLEKAWDMLKPVCPKYFRP